MELKCKKHAHQRISELIKSECVSTAWVREAGLSRENLGSKLIRQAGLDLKTKS